MRGIRKRFDSAAQLGVTLLQDLIAKAEQVLKQVTTTFAKLAHGEIVIEFGGAMQPLRRRHQVAGHTGAAFVNGGEHERGIGIATFGGVTQQSERAVWRERKQFQLASF